MSSTTEIPEEIDIFLRAMGVVPVRKHAPVFIRKQDEEDKYVPWKPSYPGEEPPF